MSHQDEIGTINLTAGTLTVFKSSCLYEVTRDVMMHVADGSERTRVTVKQGTLLLCVSVSEIKDRRKTAFAPGIVKVDLLNGHTQYVLYALPGNLESVANAHFMHLKEDVCDTLPS